MKVIGERISILKKEDLLSIVILPTVEKRKLALLFFWLLAWTVCGIIVFMNYFKTPDQNLKLFIIIYMAFWAYFEFNIVRAFMWKRAGKEKLWIKDGILHYQREVNGRGKIKEFNVHLIDDLKIIETSSVSFTDTINRSFWIKGGERMEFRSQSHVVRFGMQISDEEAKKLLKETTDFILKAIRDQKNDSE